MRAYFLFPILLSLSLAWLDLQPNEANPLPKPVELRIVQNEQENTISVFRADGKTAILTQVAKPNFRPYLHPIVAPDGKGLLTEYSPGHHKHQTGIYWGFTRVNGTGIEDDSLKKWFYRQDKPANIQAQIGRDYFHHPESDYWKRVDVKVIKNKGNAVKWETVYDLLDSAGNTHFNRNPNVDNAGGRWTLFAQFGMGGRSANRCNHW
jgi:hypothetical protein